MTTLNRLFKHSAVAAAVFSFLLWQVRAWLAP